MSNANENEIANDATQTGATSTSTTTEESEQVKALKNSAQEIRRQALEMETNLLRDKLKLKESQLEKQSDEAKQASLLDEIQALYKRLNLLENGVDTTSTTPATNGSREGSDSSVASTDTPVDAVDEKEEDPGVFTVSVTTKNETDEQKLKDFVSIGEIEVVKNKTDSMVLSFLNDGENDDEEKEYVKELLADDKRMISEIYDLFLQIENTTRTSSMLDDEEQETLQALNATLLEIMAGNVTQDKLDTIRGVKVLVEGAAKTAAFFGGKDSSKIIPYILKAMADEIKNEKDDPVYTQRLQLFENSFTNALIYIPPDDEESLSEDDALMFCNEILNSNRKIFARTAKPKPIGGAFLIEGNVLIEGNELVSRLQDEIDTFSKDGRLPSGLRIHLINDPSPQIDMDDVEQADAMLSNADEGDFLQMFDNLENLEPPALILTIPQKDSVRALILSSFVSIFGFLYLADFAGSCYVGDNDKFFETTILGFNTPIFQAVVATLLASELVQSALAFFKTGGLMTRFLSTRVWPESTGFLLPTAAEIRRPPKDNNDLFDIAMTAPMVGFVSSVVLFVLGLKATLSLNSAGISTLPRLDLDTLHLSFLSTSIINSVMGSDVLLSLDTTSDLVPCHPWTIAGFVGILLNAMSLLPSFGTHGGRMIRAVFGRFGTLTGAANGLVATFLLIQGIREWNTSSFLLFYFVVLGLQNEGDYPCLNDVDRASISRLALVVATSFLAVLALSPA